MEEHYLVINTHKSNKGEDITEFKESDGKIVVKHFSGLNTDNYVLKKGDGKKLSFSSFKINGIYYVNINGYHIVDYKKFVSGIKQISDENETRVEPQLQSDSSVIIKNSYFGQIKLRNCDVELCYKAITIMKESMKGKITFWKNIYYYLMG
uniref:Uncharacterized protein n=1 Tax=viral metagenome TaxID=1070528 RepID=A0A6C0E4B1_9ZZZZ